MTLVLAQGLFITGTDTGVGKTTVGCALASALAGRARVGVFKPVETGCRTEAGRLVPEDAVRLRAAARMDVSLDLVCPYRFAEPLAPWIAAERAGERIDPERIRESYRRISSVSDLVLIESAGGLLVPITRTYAYADLAADLALPLLVVVGSRLGAINQTRLTIECASRRGLGVAGYVLNQPTPKTDLARETNAKALANLVEDRCLGELPFLPLTGDPERDVEILRRVGEPLAERLFQKLSAARTASW